MWSVRDGTARAEGGEPTLSMPEGVLTPQHPEHPCRADVSHSGTASAAHWLLHQAQKSLSEVLWAVKSILCLHNGALRATEGIPCSSSIAKATHEWPFLHEQLWLEGSGTGDTAPDPSPEPLYHGKVGKGPPQPTPGWVWAQTPTK